MHLSEKKSQPSAAGLTGLVLAGGLSRRMGAGVEKALLPLAGRPLLRHVLERLSPQVDRLVISANGDPARFLPFALPVVADLRNQWLGPLAGVEAAFARTDAEWLLSVAVDLPFLPTDLAEKMQEPLHTLAEPLPVVAASGGRSHFVVALWPRTALPSLTTALENGQFSLYDWFQRHPHRQVHFAAVGDAPDPFFNINRPADLQEAAVWCQPPTANPAGPIGSP
ncbi:MAG: molybdenum cofactor guanylyltransferase [Magnetococcus sp. YQC-3]